MTTVAIYYFSNDLLEDIGRCSGEEGGGIDMALPVSMDQDMTAAYVLDIDHGRHQAMGRLHIWVRGRAWLASDGVP